MIITLSVTLVAIILSPFVLLKTKLPIRSHKAVILTNIGMFFMVSLALTVAIFATPTAAATAIPTAAAAATASSNGLGYLSAAICTGVACIGAGIAVAAGASAAIGATSENPGMFGKSLIFVALGEGIVLYGLLISFQILNKLG
ncbi:MAG: ATP synthase subunit C [Bacillota bacterium]|nr:ATP synthase subunit C [Bacillota bacterium]